MLPELSLAIEETGVEVPARARPLEAEGEARLPRGVRIVAASSQDGPVADIEHGCRSAGDRLHESRGIEGTGGIEEDRCANGPTRPSLVVGSLIGERIGRRERELVRER